ncbi:hypothetical protein E4V01_15660 [Methylorubrum sp. Q1]|uniref:hypothetical protein n=1 Tax=Methylorubrum sp. Q1 TaxID=2562453 RepID=UPI001075EF99|nr:hypothetical protein [Methylorubrum sp. Q1]TFZ57371.1 hypothetical protein E4V01_15660 [Methylorubrum sp. Q1]
MSAFEDELAANFAKFSTEWKQQASENVKALEGNKFYLESYRRISALNGIKHDIIMPNLSPDSASFFFEAHNDTLVSHVNASVGAWRSSLKALRSFIENCLAALYYKDHPIELELWGQGKFRIGFTDLTKYFLDHPHLQGVPAALSGLEAIKEEYATLSQAVHGSAASFRMTDSAAEILLWKTEAAKIGMWATRERKTIESVVLLIVTLYRDKLSATQLPALRQVLYYAISESKRTKLKSELKITIK